ncbi:hypothetical protein [Pasteurella atlantica]|uniref:hypothetical protein n=1 Tax=Pasteurellaceae TaxID=712 RepID=UPI00276A6C86|nr:hypothetical protein [Pasteurella atlantica]MDP8099638.1 hypothetical protein [Pasteurella atlantica]MDP8107561.1 hypothetical protein [Pasteurella atlantica]MDP8117256.1 hypothetical protein [Pasteurella atlantica]
MKNLKKLKASFAFIISSYPHETISLIRLIRIMFLSEWYYSIIKEKSLSGSIWNRRTFGPETDSILEVLDDLGLNLEDGNSELDGFTIVIKTKPLDFSLLSVDEQIIISIAMKHLNDLNFVELNSYIESLYPIQHTDINAEIKFEELAKKAP